MTQTVPFTAFCPECQAGRTFTVLGFEPVLVGSPPIYDRPRVGCCVCGTSERDALVALSGRVSDDRESLGEISARLNTLDGEVEELRDELHAHLAPAHNPAEWKIAQRRAMTLYHRAPPAGWSRKA